MKLSELSTFFDESVYLLKTTEDLDPVQVGMEAFLVPNIQHGELLLKQGEAIVGFQLSEPDGWAFNATTALWLVLSKSKDTVKLQRVDVVSGDEPLEEDISVCVDEKIRDEVARKAGFTNPSIEDIAIWLRQEFVLEENDKERIFQASYYGSNDPDSITFVGRNFLLALDTSPNGSLWIRRLSPHSRNREFSLQSIEGGLTFVDGTIAAQIARPEEVEKLRALRRDNSSYIALWENYDHISDRKAQEVARQIGYIRYVKVDQKATADGIEWRFYFHSSDEERASEFITALRSNGDSNIEVHRELPPWLNNQGNSNSTASSEYEARLSATVVKKVDSYLVVNLGRGAKPEHTGYIYCSLAGTETSSKRRKTARDNINSQRNPMPQLCHLIEGLPVTTARQNYIKPLSRSARTSFSGEPTPKQIEALDLALNTPDIALILGPPGTGKTQIISALQRRLAEVSERDINREVLVSSFQHDAVDNVVARSDVFGLPAIRVGKRDRSANILQQWINKQQSMVEKVLLQEKSSNSAYGLIDRIRNDIALLLASGRSEDEFIRITGTLSQDLRRLAGEHNVHVSSSLSARLVCASDRIQEKNHTSRLKTSDRVLQALRSLRVNRDSFLDDGADRAFECLYLLQQENYRLTDRERETLERMADSKSSFEQSDFRDFENVKTELIEKLLPDYRPRSIRTAVNSETRQLLQEISEDLTGQLSSTVAGIGDILAEYQLTLAYQKGRVKNAVEDYTTTLGATCQGSVSTEMLNTLSVMGENSISFDTVIVDEAARANPLDLFIPMSLAKRRIVLVGDHYQLPQILEPEIEKEMVETGVLREQFADSLKESLFERLYVQLREREKVDGVKRTVMLDTQFRMHPEIGQFVSKQFYENNGEPSLNSGLDRSHFEIDLPGFEDSVMHWVDVPNSLGHESRPGSSWLRSVEAERVATLAASIVEQCPKLSVGVITFYARQREAIFEELEAKDICRRTDDGWEYEPGYVSTKEGDERIRVGSVDAFQGKEFDVVILSMTRSNNHSGLQESDLNKKFGFLRLPNRLNVAFSRAKKRIIAVGDRKMFTSNEAKIAMPSVYEYASNLCGASK